LTSGPSDAVVDLVVRQLRDVGIPLGERGDERLDALGRRRARALPQVLRAQPLELVEGLAIRPRRRSFPYREVEAHDDPPRPAYR
jgi:hypothetical protein